jgi:hypothetical protein
MRNVVSGFAALLLGGCSILEDDVARGYAQSGSLTPATFTTADVRMITQRNRQGSPNPIICTEPSPDVAKALSTAAQLSGSGGNGTATGSLSAGGASAEVALALAGRSTALLGLRDGLFRACEAYANGVIGADAYALVLSRYGQLMTTLFLGQDVTGAAGTTAGASVQSPPMSMTPSPATTGPVIAAPAPSPPAPAPPPSSSATVSSSLAALALARMNEDYLNLGYSPDALVTVCVNYGDPSRVATGKNRYLESLCDTIFSGGLQPFQKLFGVGEALVKGGILAPPVNPVGGGAQSPPPAGRRP